MSRLTVYDDDAPGQPVLRTEDARAMAHELSAIGVRFERWDRPVALSPQDSAEAVLDAYRPYLDRLMGETGAGTVDVIKIDETTPDKPALRRQFLSDHVIPRTRSGSSCTARAISSCMSTAASTTRNAPPAT